MTVSHSSYSKQDKWQKWRKDVLHHTLSSFSAHFPLYFILLTVMNNRSIHAQQDGLVELAIQSSLAGFEPNTTVEISSAQVTAVHLPSTRPSFCSVYKSGEDVTTTLVSSEVDERQSIGRLAASLRVQKREASAAAARIYHSTGEKFNVKLSSHSKRGRLVATHSHRRKSSRDPRRVQERNSASDRIRTERQEVRDHLRFREDEAAEGEDAALSRLSGAEHHTRLLFEEQRNQILSDTRSEMDMQELRSEKADMVLRESNRQIHSHRVDPYHTNQVYENSRRAQAWLQAELENRERAQQETCFRTLQEVEEI